MVSLYTFHIDRRGGKTSVNRGIGYHDRLILIGSKCRSKIFEIVCVCGRREDEEKVKDYLKKHDINKPLIKLGCVSCFILIHIDGNYASHVLLIIRWYFEIYS